MASHPERRHDLAGVVLRGITPAGQQPSRPAGVTDRLLPLPQPTESAEDYDVSEADLQFARGVPERKEVTPALGGKMLRPWLSLVVLVLDYG